MPILLAFLLLSFFCSHAQTNKGAGEMMNQIDSYLHSAVNAGKFNGSALIAQKGKILLHKAYGWRNVAAKKYNDTTTLFPILSITKSFTAMVILKLQEEGKLSLQDKLSKYLPNCQNADKITIEQLLNHTSGLHNYTDDIGEEDSALVNHPVDKTMVIDLICSKPAAHNPGEDLMYNNSGYYLAGIVIEKATGKSYEKNVRELIFEPLGMKNSGFAFNQSPKNIRATGYQFLNDSIQKTYEFIDSTVGFSAGAIYSTTSDMYKWTRAIAQRLLLSSQSWETALTPKAADYGIGFRVNKFFGNGYVRHSGGYPGFVSEFVYYPEKDITIILLKNSGNYGEDVWPVTMGLSSIVLGLPYDLWKKRKPVLISEQVLKQREGKYVSDNLTIQFSVKDKQLYEILPGGNELPLQAENSTSFYLDGFNTSINFIESNGTEWVIIHEHGKDYKLKKEK